MFQEPSQQFENAQAVAKCAELAGGTRRARIVGCLDFGNGQPEIKSMYHQLGLNLETLAHGRKSLYEPAAEGFVSREQVCGLGTEEQTNQPGKQSVSEDVPWAVGFLGNVLARDIDHVIGARKEGLRRRGATSASYVPSPSTMM